jgi:integrase
MGWLKERKGAGGKVRYTAMYRDIRGAERSVGTFTRKKDAEKSWQKAEAKASDGGETPVIRGAIRFEPYVRETWFPNHRLELRSRENYTYYLDKHIIPWFGPMRMIEIGSQDIREFVTKLVDDGVKASSVCYCLDTILSAIFNTALNDQVVQLHPCKGVDGPVVAKKIRAIITPEQFDKLHEVLGDELWQILVETDIETGLRWGELTELRPKDLDDAVFTVSRAAVELTGKHRPDGARFVVKEYPKDGEHRQVSISAELAERLRDYIARRMIGTDDLIFKLPAEASARRVRVKAPEPDKLGWFGGENGDRYNHGTMTAYVAGKCRCEHCRASCAVYRRDRRAAGKDQPRRQRVIDTDGHIPRNWFRINVWVPARTAAKLGEGVKAHSMRHAHASWLLAGGADLARVKDRLGHASILTTQKYLHTLPDAENDAALDAFARIRNRNKPDAQKKGMSA